MNAPSSISREIRSEINKMVACMALFVYVEYLTA
jgi:hypothetical protein